MSDPKRQEIETVERLLAMARHDRAELKDGTDAALDLDRAIAAQERDLIQLRQRDGRGE